MSEPFAIELRGVRKGFRDTSVLRGLDLAVPTGATTTILGGSGSGKSVCLKHMIGLLRADAGEIRVLGRDVTRLSESEWTQLRRQFGREQKYTLRNLGEEPFFSEFAVTNPESKRTYRVRVRGTGPGDNHCSCPDFTTNTLGTCKHIEFTLAKLERKRGGREAFKEGYQPEYSEVFLQYGARREVRFRPGAACSRRTRMAPHSSSAA